MQKLNLSFKIHGGIITGLYFNDAANVLLANNQKTLNPNIKDYDWSNLVALTYSTANGCKDPYCPIGKYDLTTANTEKTATTKDPCFCLGIDMTDPKYYNCYCSSADNANKFPCKCFDSTVKDYPVKLYTLTRDDTKARDNCNCLTSEI